MKKNLILSMAFLLGLLLLGCDNITTTTTTTANLLTMEDYMSGITFDTVDESLLAGMTAPSLDPNAPSLPDPQDRIVAITNGTETIHMLKFLLSGERTIIDAEDSGLTHWIEWMGAGLNGFDMVEQRDEIPVIEWSENLSVELDEYSTYRDMEVFNANGHLLEDYDSLKDLPLLPHGSYFITIVVRHNQSKYSIHEFNYFRCLFILEK
jgi:hypothetical protein